MLEKIKTFFINLFTSKKKLYKEIELYKNDINKKNDIIISLNKELSNNNNKIDSLNNQLNEKNNNIYKLKNILNKKEEEINGYISEIYNLKQYIKNLDIKDDFVEWESY